MERASDHEGHEEAPADAGAYALFQVKRFRQEQ
jgi:hypothetical protein